MSDIAWKKYVLVFFITVTVFVIAFSINSVFDGQRLREIRTIENRVGLSFLALEVEADLLSDLSCENEYVSLTTADLEALSERLAYLEKQNTGEETIRDLKIQYSLFELKDYLFLKQFKLRCGAAIDFVFFFYSNEDDCDDCKRQGYVLEKMRSEFPSLRVYSFDYNLDIPGINSLKRFYNLKPNLPITIVNRNVLYGFQKEENLTPLLESKPKE